MATIEHVIEVNAAPDAVYDCLVRFDAYPSFVQDVRQVRRVGALRLEWQSGHGEQARSWEAEIVQQIPGRRVVLRTMRGPRYEVTAELGSMAAQDGGRGTAVPRTRLRLLIEFDEHEQILPEHGDVVAALRARSEQDLARFKKHVEHHVPAGVHVAALEPARTRPVELDAGAPVGKTIGQTAAEREESMRSQPHWQQPAEPHAGEHAGERHGHGLRRMTPSLPDLWNLWQQPFRMMRSFSRAVHGFEQVFESVRTGGRREETLPKAWTPTVETAQ
ncbi:MAG TPA: SRPBCC family protein, partial [Noviherbaspirillum sp.]|nr:SRPBCC family protein [Noviherbaspirillum sp.]